MNLKELVKINQQKIALTVGYLLVAGLAFGLGKFTTPITQPVVGNQQVVEQSNSDYTPNVPTAQITTANNSTDLNCQGKIKGSSSHIYHIPGGAFYNKTTRPIACFDTESQARAAGFRKSSR